MSGGALAATHYLINSKKQINPKVLKQLKGNKGATGSAGPAGPAGAAGATGATGAPGSAIAYATVVVNSVGNPAFTVNSGFSSVTEPATGEFCLTPAYPEPLITTPAGGTEVAGLYSPQQCPGGYEIGTKPSDIGGGEGFSVMVP